MRPGKPVSLTEFKKLLQQFGDPAQSKLAYGDVSVWHVLVESYRELLGLPADFGFPGPPPPPCCTLCAYGIPLSTSQALHVLTPQVFVACPRAPSLAGREAPVPCDPAPQPGSGNWTCTSEGGTDTHRAPCKSAVARERA